MKRLFSPDSKTFHDVFRDTRRNVVSLRPHAVHVEVSLSAARRAYQNHRLPFLGCSIFSILFIAFGIYRSVTWANSVVLYPSTCLGGWNNPQHAVGKPDVVTQDDPSAFTDTNSAVLPANTSSDIFCSGFTGGMPQDAQPTSITLTFSWTTKVLPAPIIISTSTPDMPPATPPTATTSPEQSTIPAPAPEAPASKAASSSPVSLLDLLIPKAHAAGDATTTASSTSNTSVITTKQNPGDGFLDVSYTLDGKTWQDLGTIDAAQMANASFNIPIAHGASWKDMSNLQIGIKSISSLDPTPTMYLDGMLLTADYQNSLQQAAQIQIATSTPFDIRLDAVSSSTPTVANSSVFTADKQSQVFVRPRFTDGSTNVTFYIDYGNNKFQYNAETVAHGNLPFSDYYAPAPGVGKYRAVEYVNDNGAFSCSGLSLSKCVADPHFVSQFSFEITASSTTATSSNATIPQ